ncbi:MAG: hypothetical protein PF961_22840 [Planctomycetota bacterium]|nr:hypothetical protein [Planctomycetota bacterium]
MTATATDPITSTDRAIITELAQRYAAACTDNERLIEAWTRHNMLQGGKPLMLLFPEGGWCEIEAENPMQCSNTRLHGLERHLRQGLYENQHFAHDKVVSPSIDVNCGIRTSGWGLEAEWTHSAAERGARRFKPVLHTIDDAERITAPTVSVDAVAGAADLAWHQDLVEAHIPVRSVGIKQIGYHLMCQYTAWRGLEETMMDFYCEPDLVHAAMQRLVAGHQALLDQYRALGLLNGNADNTYQGTGGNGWCTDLPDHGPVASNQMWSSAESQEMAGVGPAQHAEFCVPYESQLLANFGRNAYGCCEPLHDRIETVLAMPNMHRVSISPWADVRRSAEALANHRAIFSWKPNPALLCGSFNQDAVRADIATTIAICAEHNCQLEIILKDTHCCDREPWRFTRWSEICREEIDRVWG